MRVLMSFLCALCCVSLAVADETENSDDHQNLIAKIEQFNNAIREGDKQKYSDVFVDDFIFTWSRNGQVFNKAMILPNVVPTPNYNPIVDEVVARIYGGSAVVNYRVKNKSDDAGVRVTFSYSKINGEWKVIASHSTSIVVETNEQTQ